MPLDNGEPRRLPFPLRNPKKTVIETPGTPAITSDTLSDWTAADPDERVRIVMDLSLNEYVALASCVDAGRDIAYGENAIWLWWVWVRGLVSMSICGDVADCIGSSAAVQTALASYLAQTGRGKPSPTQNLGASLTDKNVLPSGWTCDDDHAYGMALYLVETLNTASVELIQQIELATDPLELVSTFVDNVEVVSYAGAAVEFIAWLQDEIADFYDAAYTPGLRNEIACELWCIIRADCKVSLDVLRSYFADQLSALSPPALDAGFDVWVQWFLTLTALSADKIIVSAAFSVALAAIAAGSNFTRYIAGFDTFEMIVVAGQDEADNDHVLCPDCPDVWTHTFDLTQPLPPELSLFDNRGIWVSGTGIEAVDRDLGAGFLEQVVTLRIDIAPNTEITGVRRVGVLGGPRYSNPQSELDLLVDPDPIMRYDAPTGAFDATASGFTILSDRILVYVIGGLDTSPTTLLSSVTLSGNGSNPFV